GSRIENRQETSILDPRSSVLFLWWMSVPMFLLFFLFAFTTGGGEPNWPITAYLSGMVLTFGWLVQQLRSASALQRRLLLSGLTVTCLLGLGLTVLVHATELAYPVLVPLAGAPDANHPCPLRRLDPTCRLRGYQTLAAAVQGEAEQLRGQGIE